jgi:hypothetical protein
MPETTMHKDDLSQPSENQVRVARQIFGVEPVPVSKGKDELPDK